MKRCWLFFMLLAGAVEASAQYVVLQDGTVVAARGLRRLGDTLMAVVTLPGQPGQPAATGEIGYPLAQVVRMDLPEPPQFKTASDLLLAGKADRALAELEPVVRFYEGLRDIPGSWWIDAARLKMQVLAASGRIEEAAAMGDRLLHSTNDPEAGRAARVFIAAGLARKGDDAKAIEVEEDTQMFVPSLDANEGSKAFNLADKVQPRRWVIHYKGRVVPPSDGKFRFVGFGDDVLTVKYNGRVVFDVGFVRPSGAPPPKEQFAFEGLILDPNIAYQGCGAGDWFDVKAGNPYPIEIITGECPGGFFKSWLLVQKDGAEYDKDAKGLPKLPIFKLSASGPPPGGGEAPPIGKDTAWSVWKADRQAAASDSLFGGDM